MKNSRRLHELARLGVLLAFALIISIIESYIPPVVPVLPYAKLGLANVVVFATFIICGVWQGYAVLLLKCLLGAVFAGNLSMVIYSIPAGVLSYTLIILLFQTRFFGVTMLSVLSAIVHNLVQLAVATAVVGKSVWIYLPYLALAGAVAGLVTGVALHYLIKMLPPKVLVDYK